MNYGYIRVSIDGDTKSQQKKSLSVFGIEKWIIEEGSAKGSTNNSLQTALNELDSNDTVYVCDFSRLAKTTVGLLETINLLKAKGIRLFSIKEHFDSNEKTSSVVTDTMQSIIDFERLTALEKQKEGIALAKEEGKLIGRQPTLIDKDSFDFNYEDYINRKITKVEFAKRLNITRPTLDKFIKAYELSEISVENNKYFVDKK